MAQGTRSGGCVVGSTKIFLKTSEIKISDIARNSTNVLFHIDLYEPDPREIVRISDPEPIKGLYGHHAYPLFLVPYTPDPIIEITCHVPKYYTEERVPLSESKTLRTTLAHPFLLVRPQKIIPAGQLRKGDLVFGILPSNESCDKADQPRHSEVVDIRMCDPEPVFNLILGSEHAVAQLTTNENKLVSQLSNQVNLDKASETVQNYINEYDLSLTDEQIDAMINQQLRNDFSSFIVGEKSSYRDLLAEMSLTPWHGLEPRYHFFYTDYILSGDSLIQTALDNFIRDESDYGSLKPMI